MHVDGFRVVRGILRACGGSSSKKLLPNIPRSKPSIRAKIIISSCNEVTFHFVPFCSFGNTKFIA